MNWEGFFRSLSSDFGTAIGSISVVIVAYCVALFFIRRGSSELLEKDNAPVVLRTMRRVLGVLVLLTVVVLFGRAASVAFANRMPRNDINKSPVYEQMDSHGNEKKNSR